MTPDTWIVFHWHADPENEGRIMPCVVGVFNEEPKAIEACTTDEHYVFPMVMNEADNGVPKAHPLCYYPLAQWKNELIQKSADRSDA